jgi:DNA modification methylase
MDSAKRHARVQAVRVPDELLAAIAAKDPISGHTHNFYRYPARFSPLFVREVIRQYSKPGDVVLDPFMGGGTAIVEALALARKAIGVDLNSLAHFVTSVKTTPLSRSDVELLRFWLGDVQAARLRGIAEVEEPVRNLPRRLQRVWADLMEQADWLPVARQKHFVRCALLKMGQAAIDCKDAIPSGRETMKLLAEHLEEMIKGAEEFASSCRKEGLKKNQIRQNRLLFCRSTAGMEAESKLGKLPKPKLVITSPPYPAVHILYHRWQVQGRRETPAPYWLAALKDGHAASHYTFGSRSPLGLENYFRNVEECFRSVRQVVAPDAVVVQLVAFSDTDSQLPRYLAAMEAAGFAEREAFAISFDSRVWRKVPNRKWYCHNGKEQDSAKEVVLFHSPA